MKLFIVLFSLVFAACTQQADIQNLFAGPNTASIINGDMVKAGDPIASHIVAITDNQWENCTGTIIANNLVLTAAHCETAGVAMYVAFGLEVSERNIKTVDRRLVRTYRLVPGHKDIDFESQDTDFKDMMIVEFEGGLPEGYKPAEFLSDSSVLKNGVSVILAGYGVTNGVEQTGNGFLRKTHAPIADVDFAETEVITDERRRGTCSIDSGGPAFVGVGDKLYLWGVTSRGDEKCRGEGVYTKISSFRSWVDSVIKELAVP